MKYIFCKFQKEGIHRYPEALTNPELEDVSFLGYPHRHMFWFEVYLEVNHLNRDVEFIQFKRWLESLYQTNTLQLDYRSCEMIADDLAIAIKDKYPGRKIKIIVSEDNENGCIAEYQ
jgi:hypothetical protein